MNISAKVYVARGGIREGAERYSPSYYFYRLYQPYMEFTPQVGEQKEESITPQVVEQIQNDLFSVPWGHHRFIIDKFKEQPEKALFFVRQTVENGWSRDMLLNFMSTDLYERQGKALSNFERTLPEETSELAMELTKDPYDFAFTGITGKYNEALLKDKLLGNITQFLVELGTGFGYQPLAISEYELEKFYPEKVEGIPTIEEIEAKLSARLKDKNGNV